MLEDFERDRITAYFTRVTSQFVPTRRASSIAVTHLLAERPLFLHALAQLTQVCALLPKPKSIDPTAHREASRHWRCDRLDRDRFACPEQAVSYLEE